MTPLVQKAIVGASALVVLAAGVAIGLQAQPSQTTGAATTYPTPATTGVPAGTALANYTGPMTISTCGVVIDSKIINGDLNITKGNGTHSSSTPCVTIKNSRILGIIDDGWTSKYNAGPVVVTDSEIGNTNARDVACISDTNYYVWRSYVHGCRSGAQTDGFTEIHDSYLLADVEFGTAHMDAFITNGNYGQPLLLDHNSFLCKPTNSVPNGAGCAADVGTFGDFSAITKLTMTNNIFRATSDAYFCLHSPYESSKPYPNGGQDVITGNVFEKGSNGKCGGAGPVYQWSNVAGTWCNNLFDDGTPVLPGNPDNCGSVPPTTVTTTTVTVPPTSTVPVSSVPPPTTTTVPTTTTKPATTTTVPATTTVPTFPPTTTTTVRTTPTTECLHTVPLVCTVAVP